MLSKKHIAFFIQENKRRILITLIFGCMPTLFCILYCKAYGGSLKSVFIPNSYWNDELFYFKQVEGILFGKGYPLGYFGYNESHARLLSFGVWNPLLFLPWVMWGLVFGWNFYSPVLCNLFCITIAIMIFSWFTKPKCCQAISIVLMLMVFTPVTRFVLSSVVESFFCSALFVYAGLFLAYAQEKKNTYFAIILLLIIVLTIIRPYYFLLVFLMAISFQNNGAKQKSALISTGILGLLGYYFMTWWFSASYPIKTIGGFFYTIGQNDFTAAIKTFSLQIFEILNDLCRFLKLAVKYGNQQGCMYGIFGILGVIFLLIFFQQKNEYKQWARIALGMFAVYACMMAAIMFMYSISNGGRHLLAFIMLGIIFLGMYQTKNLSIILKIIVILPLIFLFGIKPGTDYDRQVPFADKNLQQELKDLQEELSYKMEISKELSWDNTVIWLSYDIVDGEIITEQWQQLYALPAGVGINHCSPNYFLDNFENIKSRYIAAVPGGEVEIMLQESGASFVAGNENIAIWDRQ